MWDVRGGGLYATGFALTFLWYELTSIVDDLANVGMLFSGRAIEFLIGFAIDSFWNTIEAFMWPVHIVKLNPPWGPIALGLAFWLFPIYVKPHIEKWMFDGDDVKPNEEQE